jgi:hypothetical protein
MDVPELPMIETWDTQKIGRKSVRRPRVALGYGLGCEGSRGDSAVSSAMTGSLLPAGVGYAASGVTTNSRGAVQFQGSSVCSS